MTDKSKAVTLAKATGIEKVVSTLFKTATPKQFIKSRPSGGGMVKYVEVGYVIGELNNAFGPFWEWKIIDKTVGAGDIWVQGELTVKDQTSGFSITKTGFGGSKVKKTKDGNIMNIGNDLKAASSDALKKAASLFGIASDVFFKEMDTYEDLPDEVDTEANVDASTTRIVMNKLFAVGAERGFTADAIKEKVKPIYHVESMNDLTVDNMEQAIRLLEQNYQVVEPGETPLRVGEIKKITPQTAENDDIPADITTHEEISVEPEEVEMSEANFDKPIKEVKKTENKCYFCKTVLPEGMHFCDESCRDAYWDGEEDGETKASKERRFEEFTKTGKFVPPATANA